MIDDIPEGSTVIQFDDFTLDRDRHQLQRNGDPLKLATRPCEVLGHLILNHGHAVSKAELLKAIWGNEDGDPNLVEQNIRQIRSVIEANPKNPQRIVTITGSGYRFMGPFSFLSPSSTRNDLYSNGASASGTAKPAPLPGPSDPGSIEEAGSRILGNLKAPRQGGILLRRSPPVFVGLGLVLILVVGGLLYATAPGEPAACEVSVDTLIVKDGQGREVWRRVFDEHLSQPFYADHPPVCRYVDLDHDGIADVLYASKLAGSELKSDTLYGFITPRRLLTGLHFAPSRTLTFHPGTPLLVGPNSDPKIDRQYDEYLPPYAIESIFVESLPDGKPRIIVSSGMGEAPDQIAVLDGDFDKLGEYWHAGVLKYGQFATYDGHDRIFLGGVNNGYHSATVVAFDPGNVNGTTDLTLDLPDRNPNFAILATGARGHLRPLGRGTETCRVLFERTCVAKARPHREPYNRVIDLRVTDDRIFATVAEGEKEESRVRVVYEMDRHFNLVEAGPTTEFQQRHMELERAGLLAHAFSPEELKPLIHVLPGCEFLADAN